MASSVCGVTGTSTIISSSSPKASHPALGVVEPGVASILGMPDLEDRGEILSSQGSVLLSARIRDDEGGVESDPC